MKFEFVWDPDKLTYEDIPAWAHENIIFSSVGGKLCSAFMNTPEGLRKIPTGELVYVIGHEYGNALYAEEKKEQQISPQEQKLIDLLTGFPPPHPDSLAYAAKIAPQGGLMFEFGVGEGTSINIIANAVPQRKVFGFDCFTGLPEDWKAGNDKGKFAQDQLPVVPQNVELIVGLFEDTLDEFINKYSTYPVSFVHLDADLYSSTSFILNKFIERDLIHPGAIMVFDEIYDIHGGLSGENFRHEGKAFIEFLEKTGYSFEFVGRRNNESFAFRIIK